MHKSIVTLSRLARKHDVALRQSYVRVAKRAALMAGRYAHARQFKRHSRELRFLCSHLGRLIRDIRQTLRRAKEQLRQSAVAKANEWTIAQATRLKSSVRRDPAPD